MFTLSVSLFRLKRQPPLSNLLSLSLLSLLCFSCLGYAQSTPEIATLELGNPVERELAGPQEHVYHVMLADGQYATVVVEQRGVDTLVQLIGTDGKSIVDFDAELRANGEERVEFVAPTAGNYRLVVKARYPKLPAGRYEIRFVEVRGATENDRLLDEALRLRAAAWRLRMASKYAEAFPLAEKALELQERVLGPEDPELARTLYVLAAISEFKVEFAKAEAFYLRGQKIAEKALGPQNQVTLARLLNTCAWHYLRNRSDYARAELMYQRALAIWEKTLGSDHPEVAQSLSDLGFLFNDIGDYVRAEAALQRALSIYEKSLPEGHGALENTLNRLALVYREKGDYLKAEPLFQRSLNYWEKTFGPVHGWVAIGLNNLAELYVTTGDFDRAEPLLQRALSINEKRNGPDHPAVFIGRYRLSRVYYNKGDYAKAEALGSDALPALEKVLGPNHLVVGSQSHLLAKIYIARNDHTKAEPLARRALTILEAVGGPNYYSLADVLFDLASVSAAQGKLAEAVTLQTRANAIIEYNLNVNLATGSERQKVAYLATLSEQLNRAISLHVRSAGDDPAARGLAATSILQRKGRVQDALSNSLASLRDRFGPEDRALLDHLNSVTSQMARLVLSEPKGVSIAEHLEKIKRLEAQREKLENEVSRRSLGFYRPSKTNTLGAVQTALPSEAALVEFAIYRPFDPKADHAKAYGESRYIVYILRRVGDVRIKDLGPANVINVAVNRLRQAVRDPRRKDVQQVARELDEKVMRPVRELIGDASQLLISPDGELNLVPFEVFIDERGQNLIETYSVSYLTTGRDLIRMQVARASESQPAVIANPFFGEKGSDTLFASVSRARPTRVSKRPSITNTRNLSDTYFAPLSGTAHEATSIKTLFPEAKLLTDSSATETAVKELTAPKLLHIATHGYFLDDEDSRVNKDGGPPERRLGKSIIENPLLRSGLALAGANRRSGGTDDGILTALEASGLNLWGTKLVVLSACDTGLGEIRNGDGVYGLRRSFVLAGAESLVMSLWPVSDFVTRDLMTNYYKNLKNGMGRGEALRQVQLSMIKQPQRRHPFYWASFIQSGEWANLDGKR